LRPRLARGVVGRSEVAAKLLPAGARFVRRFAVLIVLGWIVVAAASNVLVPQLDSVAASHAPPFMPADAPSVVAADRSAEVFDAPPSNNLVYVVLERDQPLAPEDRRFYDELVTALRADTGHVSAVTDLWSPLSASAAQSQDGHAVNLMLRLTGMLGTSAASESITAVRDAVTRLDPPTGLHVYVTGPGATLADEFTAVGHQMLAVTAATVVLITLLLLFVYRSVVAVAVPLMSVGLTLAVARAVVAALGNHGLVEVSLFTVALIGAMILGAGTDYGIFLIGRYHEGRRRGIDPETALAIAYRTVAPVIIGSALTIAAALSCLNLASISMFRSIGLPCAIGIVIAALASLTLTPALMSLASRRGLLEPRRAPAARRWRRMGIMVARWPGPLFVATAGLIVVLALPLLIGMRTSWNEPSATPPTAESNLGYAVVDRHFPANQLFPDVLTVSADHDLRNPAGLIAIERITRQIMAIPGVRMVQSASRPAGTIPNEANLSYQAGLIGQQLNDSFESLTDRLNKVSGDLNNALSQLGVVVGQMGRPLAAAGAGMGNVNSAADSMRTGIDGLQTNITTVSGYLDPLRNFTNNTPNCPMNPICSVVEKVVDPVDSLVRSSNDLSTGAAQLTAGSGTATTALVALPQTLQQMRGVLGQAQSATSGLGSVIGAISPQLQGLTDYLREIQLNFQGSAAGGFYIPVRAMTDPRYQEALRVLVSPDGRAALLLVYGRGQEWGTEGAQRATQIQAAVEEATKEGTLTPVSVEQVGVGITTRDLQGLLRDDIVLLVLATLALVFLIVAVMLRSPVAALVVVGTVIVSYASALGVSVLVWQHLLGHPLHWVVPPIAFIAMVAVGADYNLLLALRLREEARIGIGTGMIRAFAGTGGVVTTAGIVFGITMFAMVGSTVLTIAQMGTTIGIGLLLDALVVRTLLMPTLVMLLGRWFWWPTRVTAPRWQQPARTTQSSDI
jgi:RND superfamily putative drug exporter